MSVKVFNHNDRVSSMTSSPVSRCSGLMGCVRTASRSPWEHPYTSWLAHTVVGKSYNNPVNPVTSVIIARSRISESWCEGIGYKAITQ